jgi:hypothetical protein
MKAGQFPALTIEPSPELTKALGQEDAEQTCFGWDSSFEARVYRRLISKIRVNRLLQNAVDLCDFVPPFIGVCNKAKDLLEINQLIK